MIATAVPVSRSAPGPIPLPANLIRVPLYEQETNYSCGDASTLGELRFWKWDQFKNTPESDLYAPLQTTPQDGTDPRPMEAFLNQQHLQARFRTDAQLSDLEALVDQKRPPIVDLEAWQDTPADWGTDWDDGHYTILVGYDDKNLFFMDPSTEGQYAYIPKDEFMQRWHDELGPQNQHVQHMMIEILGDGGIPHQAQVVNPLASAML